MDSETKYEFGKYELEILKDALKAYCDALNEMKEFPIAHIYGASFPFSDVLGSSEKLLERIDRALNR